jgi:hypothetical protein
MSWREIFTVAFFCLCMFGGLGYFLYNQRMINTTCNEMCAPYGMHQANDNWCVCGGPEGPTVKAMP